jgi:diguanylate cyclase (GGDEF)-like protein
MADAPPLATRRADHGGRDLRRGRHNGGGTTARRLALVDLEERSREAGMDHDHVDEGSLPDVLSRPFVGLTAVVVIAAAGCVAVLALGAGWHVGPPVRFWLLALFILAGELLPIPVPRRQGLDKVAVSTAFAFAALLSVGILPACAVYATASVIADLSARTAPIKVIFNSAQYILSLAGAGAVLMLAGAGPPVALHAAVVPAILLAALTCFVINHVLAGAGAALLAHLPVIPYLVDDLAFHALTAGGLLALSPGVVASSAASVTLIPLAFVPVLAIYFGGRQAGTNAHRAFHDGLTGLPNRWRLIEHVTSALRAAHHAQTGVAVMIIDLDDFKSINDTLGHQFGDRVLQLVAPRLAQALGPHGLLARLGGDEFAAVLVGVRDGPEAVRHAEQLLVALQRPCEVDSLVLHVSGSVGVAMYPEHGRTVDVLLRHADVALYCAKSERSTCAIYTHEDDEHSIDRLALAAQLRGGIDRGELVVHYQPKVPLNPSGTYAVEALVRWNHPLLGCIGPDGFIPLAEQTGLIRGVTDRVLEAALGQCEMWRAGGLDIRFSVNLSTRTLLDPDLPETIRALLTRFAVPPASLQLEITESRFVADVGRARKVLNELRTMGVTIAIDDFGTGYSSLSQLQQLPIDEIKIDRSFVMRMETDPDDAVLVRSIVELGHNLGLRVTAEGVETASVHRSLQQLGCDFAQGFHISRPVPADECHCLLNAMPRPPPSLPTSLVSLSAAERTAGARGPAKR